MNVALTNYSVRYTAELLKQDRLSRIERIPETLSREKITLQYRRNPLEHVERVIR